MPKWKVLVTCSSDFLKTKNLMLTLLLPKLLTNSEKTTNSLILSTLKSQKKPVKKLDPSFFSTKSHEIQIRRPNRCLRKRQMDCRFSSILDERICTRSLPSCRTKRLRLHRIPT